MQCSVKCLIRETGINSTEFNRESNLPEGTKLCADFTVCFIVVINDADVNITVEAIDAI